MILQGPSVFLSFVATALLAASPVDADGLYTSKSPVLQVDHNTYDKLIGRSNYTSIVEFYAPWCGHCQNLKPAFEKAAKNLEGLAKVAAVNCDDDANKPFCGRMGVQGFPTLKMVVPGKQPEKPLVEDYTGARTAKAIVDAVVDRIPNHVKKLTEKSVDEWLSETENVPKAILFTQKGTTSALMRAIAIDFLGKIKFAQIRGKGSGVLKKFDVEDLPTLVLLPAGEEKPIYYRGELKKQQIAEFLSQVAAPNLDPASYRPLSSSKKTKSAKSSVKPKPTASITLDVEDEDLQPTGSPNPKIIPDDAKDYKPAQIPIEAPPIDVVATVEALESACLTSMTPTCVLALLPPTAADTELPATAKEALLSLAEISHKYSSSKRKLFPLYSVPAINEGAKILREGLGLMAETESEALELIALNGRRGWWRRYESLDYGLLAVEAWIDGIRLGEGKKETLPDGILVGLAAKRVETETETQMENAKVKEHDEL